MLGKRNTTKSIQEGRKERRKGGRKKEKEREKGKGELAADIKKVKRI